jgi:hypothetical protein
MTNVSIPGASMLKNSWTLAVSVAINISMKLCFVSVNGPRETYFVDEPRNLYTFLIWTALQLRERVSQLCYSLVCTVLVWSCHLLL